MYALGARRALQKCSLLTPRALFPFSPRAGVPEKFRRTLFILFLLDYTFFIDRYRKHRSFFFVSEWHSILGRIRWMFYCVKSVVNCELYDCLFYSWWMRGIVMLVEELRVCIFKWCLLELINTPKFHCDWCWCFIEKTVFIFL